MEINKTHLDYCFGFSDFKSREREKNIKNGLMCTQNTKGLRKCWQGCWTTIDISMINEKAIYHINGTSLLAASCFSKSFSWSFPRSASTVSIVLSAILTTSHGITVG